MCGKVEAGVFASFVPKWRRTNSFSSSSFVKGTHALASAAAPMAAPKGPTWNFQRLWAMSVSGKPSVVVVGAISVSGQPSVVVMGRHSLAAVGAASTPAAKDPHEGSTQPAGR